MATKTEGAYIVPTEERTAFKRMVQRANRRVLSGIDYLKANSVRDPVVRHMIAGDYYTRRRWATKANPFSSSTRFKSREDYEAFMKHLMRWGEDTGRRGGYAADPKRIRDEWATAIYKTLNGLSRNKGISLEKWGGDLPPELRAKIEGMSLEQLTQFYDYVDPTGEEWLFDSDQVVDTDVDDYIEYIDGRLSALQKYFPKPKPKKKRAKKASRKKKK